MKSHTTLALRVIPAVPVQFSLDVQGVLADLEHAFHGLCVAAAKQVLAAMMKADRRAGTHCEGTGAGGAAGIPPQDQAKEAAVADQCELETVRARPQRLSWARLLKRAFDMNTQHRPNCGAGELKIIAAILERAVLQRILTHLGLDPQPPPRGRVLQAGQDFTT